MDNHGGRPLRDDAVVAVGILRGGTVGVYTSHWNNPELGEVDAVMVSISRGQPRWKLPFSYRRMDELAPDDRVWYADDEEWRGLYRDQLDRIGPEAVLGRLAGIAGGKPCVLLCYEKDPADCHRGVVVDYLLEHGEQIKELKPGDLPLRPDNPQPSLFDPTIEETP